MAVHKTKLAQVLAKQGRKKSWLAEALHVDRSTITRWVKGETNPREWRKVQIARLLGLPIRKLWP